MGPHVHMMYILQQQTTCTTITPIVRILIVITHVHHCIVYRARPFLMLVLRMGGRYYYECLYYTSPTQLGLMCVYNYIDMGKS